MWTKTLTSAHGRPLDVADVVELNVLTRLRHRNVNRVLDVFVERRRIHWVSPFCGRGSLWVRRRHLVSSPNCLFSFF